MQYQIHSDSALGVFVTAERLMKDFSEAEGKKSNTPWSRPSRLFLLFL